jgi:hypothetical protein
LKRIYFYLDVKAVKSIKETEKVVNSIIKKPSTTTTLDTNKSTVNETIVNKPNFYKSTYDLVKLIYNDKDVVSNSKTDKFK